jgi:large subunit ribosomal protein L9
MKVILLQDVAKIGRRTEVVEVPDGYALNQLIPKKMAEPATKSNLKKIEKLHTTKTQAQTANQETFTNAVAILRENSPEIEVEANDQGHTFKAVSAADVAESANKNGANIDSSMVVFSEPIKSIGEHEIELKVDDSVAKFTIKVVSK